MRKYSEAEGAHQTIRKMPFRAMEDGVSGSHSITISYYVYRLIYKKLGCHPAERGAILGRDTDGVVRHFCYDEGANCSRAEYTPDIETLNRVIKAWRSDDIEFCMIIHTHPLNVRGLSWADVELAGRNLPHFDHLDCLWLPIVMTVPDSGSFEIHPHVCVPDADQDVGCRVEPGRLLVERGGKLVEPRLLEHDGLMIRS